MLGVSSTYLSCTLYVLCCGAVIGKHHVSFIKHTSFCIFLIHKTHCLYSRVLYCDTLQGRNFTLSLVFVVNCKTYIPCHHCIECVCPSECVLWKSIAWTLCFHWLKCYIVKTTYRNVFSCRCDDNALFYSSEIVILARNLNKVSTLCSVK